MDATICKWHWERKGERRSTYCGVTIRGRWEPVCDDCLERVLYLYRQGRIGRPTISALHGAGIGQAIAAAARTLGVAVA